MRALAAFLIVEPYLEMFLVGTGFASIALILGMESLRFRINSAVSTGSLKRFHPLILWIYHPRITAWTGATIGLTLTVLSLTTVQSLAALTIGIGLVLFSFIILNREKGYKTPRHGQWLFLINKIELLGLGTFLILTLSLLIASRIEFLKAPPILSIIVFFLISAFSIISLVISTKNCLHFELKVHLVEGSALLFLGLSTIWTLAILVFQNSSNLMFSFNTFTLLIFAILTFVIAFMVKFRSMFGWPHILKRLRQKIFACYAASSTLMVALMYALIIGIIPSFTANGFIFIGQSTIVISLVLFSFSALIFGMEFGRHMHRSFLWYCLSFSSFAIGMIAFLIGGLLSSGLEVIALFSELNGSVCFAVATVCNMKELFWGN